MANGAHTANVNEFIDFPIVQECGLIWRARERAWTRACVLDSIGAQPPQTLKDACVVIIYLCGFGFIYVRFRSASVLA